MLNLLIQSEFSKLHRSTDYYGSEKQIEMENFIVEDSKIEPLEKETLEEYYLRIWKK